LSSPIPTKWSQARAQDVERSELPPLPGAAPADTGDSQSSIPGLSAPPSFVPQSSGVSAETSALPYDLWRGVDEKALQGLIAATKLPSPSPAFAALIARALAADDQANGDALALRVGALERAGRVAEIAELLSRAAQDPAMAGSYAVALIASGREKDACQVAVVPGLAKDALLVPVYCAAMKQDIPGAKLALQLARDGGADAGLASAVLNQRQPPLPKTVGVMDYVFLKLGDKPVKPDLAAKASPELLYMIAHEDAAQPELRLAAAERAASLNIIAGDELARAYREASAKLSKAAQSGPALRAKLFAAFESAPSANVRAESIAALLASARDQDIEVPVAQALAEASAGLIQDPQSDFFAETGVRIAALAGDEESAWAWIDTGGERMRSWQLLLAASDPQGPRAEAALSAGIDIALKGGLPPPLLHRLVTVLDALDYEVPMPLWDAASKTAQPEDGDLPPTGALTTLKQAADAGEVGRTVLLAAAVLGANGAKGAHLIALGDALRALKRVGLDAEARRLGFESLYAHWPSRGKA
jgi:hypothetical protein